MRSRSSWKQLKVSRPRRWRQLSPNSGFGFPITGCPDHRITRCRTPPPCTQLGSKGFNQGHPNPSQIGVDFSVQTSFGVGFKALPLCSFVSFVVKVLGFPANCQLLFASCCLVFKDRPQHHCSLWSEFLNLPFVRPSVKQNRLRGSGLL
jgi:hypothetical protein